MKGEDLVKVIARRLNISNKEATNVLTGILNQLCIALKTEGSITLRNFGKLSLDQYHPDKNIVFTASKRLRDVLASSISEEPVTSKDQTISASKAIRTGRQVGTRKKTKKAHGKSRPRAGYIRKYTGGRIVDIPIKRDPKSGKKSSRFLQTQIQQKIGREDKVIRKGDELKAKRKTKILVRVGYQNKRWNSLNESFISDYELKAPLVLDVYFWETSIATIPIHSQLDLPTEGASLNPAIFEVMLNVGVNVRSIEARITVVYSGQVLQTGTLTANIGDSKNGCQLEFKEEAMPVPNLGNLPALKKFDSALVFNHGNDNTPRVFEFSGVDHAVIDIDQTQLNNFTAAIGSFLEETTDDPEAFKKLESESSVEFYRKLAQKGSTLRKEIIKYNDVKKGVRSTKRLQIVSTRDSYMPAEFLYDLPAPEEKATMCSGFKRALKNGKCCQDKRLKKDMCICPLGFWGLSRVIERHAHTPEHRKIKEGVFKILVRNAEQRDPIEVQQGVLFAASDRADAHNSDMTKGIHKKLTKLFTNEKVPNVIRKWEQWEEEIKTTSKNILVLVPHHDIRDHFEILEIGASAQLKSNLIKEKHVSIDEAVAPIVLLIGCETTQAKISFDGFVRGFHDAGASIIVGTVSTILGRHAGPATEILVEEIIKAAKKKQTIGVALLNARRKLVGEGFPISMGVTGYGGADWKLM